VRPRSVYLVASRGYESITSSVISEFKRAGLELERDSRKSDVVVIVGRDRDLLSFLQEKGGLKQPVLGIDVLGGSSFLAEVPVSDVAIAAKKLAKGEFSIERLSRLAVLVDNKSKAYALNEVALFASRSALLVEYSLVVDDQVIWRDYSDGVIVATPTGSTAYALSAGGPVLHKNLGAFVIVPVNSMDTSRRPLVVPAASRIRIEGLSRVCDAVDPVGVATITPSL
jgi:NAD+ kinase